MRFDSATRTLSFENGHTALFHGEELHFEVLADTTTMEFCFQDSSMATYEPDLEGGMPGAVHLPYYGEYLGIENLRNKNKHFP